MRYPDHIILDLQKTNNQNNNNYWVNTYVKTSKYNYFFINNSFKKSINFKSKSFVTSTSKSLLLVNNTKLNDFSLLWSLLDINFIKREKLYTKLKYSRSPQYDIVSGGIAALFAGFVGFLISEKFGIELVDSGDFYIFFMYCVFFSFSLRPLVKILSKENSLWNFFSYKFALNFYFNICLLSLNYIISFFKKK